MKPYKTILVIKMSSLGDIIHSLPTLSALRKNCPNARIVWAVHERFAGVLPGKPYIDDILYVDRKRLKSPSYWWELAKELRAYNFDISIDLQCLSKSALVALLSGAKEKYGYWEVREISKWVNKPLVGPNQYGHVIERYLDTVRMLGGTVEGLDFPFPNIEAAEHSSKEKLKAAGIEGPYALVVPGARWGGKEWPPAYYGELCKRLCEEGLSVVLTGTAEDLDKTKEIASIVKSDKLVDMANKTSLHELLALIKHSKLFISGDTGPLHMANALKKPIIALYGPTAPNRLGPYGYDEIEIVVSPTTTVTDKKFIVDDEECIKDITPDSVWEAYQRLMQGSKKDGLR